MSASTCVIYFGLRFDVDVTDIEALEARSDARMVAARKVGLRCYWGNFGAPGERYLLFVGSQIGLVGSENQTEVQLEIADIDAMLASVQAKLVEAGLEGEPRLHVQWQADV